MAVTNLLSNKTQFLDQVRKDFSDIDFIESEKSMWEPESGIIFYRSTDENLVFSILHELGHMIAGHKDYSHDIQLLIMETEAWQNAKKIALKYDIEINADHTEDCLDTYRNWLHKRSTCPKCSMTGSQKDSKHYSCLNCHAQWSVSKSRFCRAYRKTN